MSAIANNDILAAYKAIKADVKAAEAAVNGWSNLTSANKLDAVDSYANNGFVETVKTAQRTLAGKLEDKQNEKLAGLGKRARTAQTMISKQRAELAPARLERIEAKIAAAKAAIEGWAGLNNQQKAEAISDFGGRTLIDFVKAEVQDIKTQLRGEASKLQNLRDKEAPAIATKIDELKAAMSEDDLAAGLNAATAAYQQAQAAQAGGILAGLLGMLGFGNNN